LEVGYVEVFSRRGEVDQFEEGDYGSLSFDATRDLDSLGYSVVIK